MPDSKSVAWVRPAEPIRGLDHLGVQAPCIALYGQLLPGITNVTDRARYYSFYPWLIWSFETRYKNHSLDEFRRVVRRAECLFALIAIRHARKSNDGDEGRHGQRMVGRDKLLRIDEDEERIVLDEYTGLEGPNRYFKNPLGGLGQYYFGPLRDLRVIDRTKEGVGYPFGYDRQRGRALAAAFARGMPGDQFFRALGKSAISWKQLDELAAFCPCALQANPVEHSLLLDLFLARTADYREDGGLTRQASLGLILDLASRDSSESDYRFETLLRGAAYSGCLVGGASWTVVSALQQVQRGWGTYQRNELLSLGVQGLFAGILQAVERDRGGRLQRVEDVADVAIALCAVLDLELSESLSSFVAATRERLPELGDWRNPVHELQHGWKLQGLGLDDERPEEVVAESLSILAALLARGVDEYPYSDFELDPEYFDPREIHLLSFRHVARSDWAHLTVGEWIRWLAVHWGVSRHLKVALRKLRGERRDTFRIRPLENELRVVEVPAPTFTLPRIDRTIQILRDLDLIALDDTNTVVPTPRGLLELEVCRGA